MEEEINKSRDYGKNIKCPKCSREVKELIMKEGLSITCPHCNALI